MHGRRVRDEGNILIIYILYPSPLPLSHSFQSWERGVSCLNSISD
jgi:hypothetical protein